MTIWMNLARAAVAAAGLVLPCAQALAAPEPMTRSAIIELAKPAVGHAYHWGKDTWTADGSKKGTCKGAGPTAQVTGTYGTDCSGYVAKAWQLPGPAPLTKQVHPFDTEAFRFREVHWKRIPRAALLRGDALVYRDQKAGVGHIVLFDRFGEQGTLWVYEARGCAEGVVYNQRTLGDEYVAIRRNDLVEEGAVACGPNGRDLGGGSCSCQLGYTGERCEACAPGFRGFPTCAASPTSCQPLGKLACNSTTEVWGQDGSGPAGCAFGTGQATLYQLETREAGLVRVELEGPKELTASLFRGACSEPDCAAAAGQALALEHGPSALLSLALVAPAGSTAKGTLRITCEPQRPSWIGDRCQADSDCDLSHHPEGKGGRCHQSRGASFCSMPCTRLCPDLPGEAAETFCVADPEAPAQGLCVSRAEPINDRCARVAGTAALMTERFGEPGVQRLACVPGLAPCEAEVAGSVTAWGSEPLQPIAGALVQATANGRTQTTVTDADGSYHLLGLSCENTEISVSREGYLDERSSVALTSNAVYSARLSPLPASCAGQGSTSGSVVDAVTGSPVAGVKLSVIPTHSTGAAPQTVTDVTGSFTFSGLAGGRHELRVLREGYAPAEEALEICGGQALQRRPIELVPLSDAGITFLLTWDRPEDLDLHLQLPNGEEVFFAPFCSGDGQGFPYATLAADRKLAGGPELIRVSRAMPGRYRLFVHNYSQAFSQSQAGLASSNAVLRAFDAQGRLLAQLSAPTQGNGLFWEILEFEGGKEQLTPIGRLSNERPRPEAYEEACRP
jgi:hypothetical protein